MGTRGFSSYGGQIRFVLFYSILIVGGFRGHIISEQNKTPATPLAGVVDPSDGPTHRSYYDSPLGSFRMLNRLDWVGLHALAFASSLSSPREEDHHGSW